MKTWVRKLIDQFDIDGQNGSDQKKAVTDECATLLFVIDVLNKHLLEIDARPVRKVREILDEFATEMINPEPQNLEKLLFRFRQFYQRYRIDEYTYVQRTFEDFRSIIWDFVDQLSDDMQFEQAADDEIRQSLAHLREAVEANTIDDVKQQSREFIDHYVEYQVKKDFRKTKKVEKLKKNIDVVKKKLAEADQSSRRDHLTQAYNRKSFDEHVKQCLTLAKMDSSPLAMICLDIDHFKKINDSFGHDGGDFVLVEFVKTMQEAFQRDTAFVARVGGEEFSIVLSKTRVEDAVRLAETFRKKIEGMTLKHKNMDVRFTVSVGIAQYIPGENMDQWIKRADQALYNSKNTGRNKCTLAPHLNTAA